MPSQEEVYNVIKKADSFRDQKNWHEARNLYLEALAVAPNLSGIWVQLGHTCKELGNYEQAEQAYKSALNIEPDNADTLLQIGHLYKVLKQNEKAKDFYLKSQRLAPNHPEIDTELSVIEHLIKVERVRKDIQIQPRENYNMRGEKNDSSKYNLVFDVSDLIQYFQNARLPTGIQRVQIEVVTNLIFNLPQDFSLKIACFTKQADSWVELPKLFFNHICKLSLVGGEATATDWIRVLEELKMHLGEAPDLKFTPGAFLINLGTSWWLQNYFMHVRLAKARYGIKYVPFVHDCIPIITPEHCVKGLTRDFISWALGAFQHSDHLFVNSTATANDVTKVAKYLGHDIANPKIIRLDADYRSATQNLPSTINASSSALFLRNGLKSSEYVLFVSTIESRKNHVMAFNAWLKLIKKYGINEVPKLVCVGNHGWLNDAVYAKVNSSDLLKKKVVFLSKIPDQDLGNLYQSCLFTIYPSSYEGWGLPVTESLCYGKVPLLSDSSSLPEAGGEFGVYFALAPENSLIVELEKLVFDGDYRGQLENKIESHFKPRKWMAIASEIAATTKLWQDEDQNELNVNKILANEDQKFASAIGLWPFPAEAGKYCSITENLETQIWPDMRHGEIYRQGSSWWWPEPWGSWTKPGTSRLAFIANLEGSSGAIIHIQIRGIQSKISDSVVKISKVGEQSLKLQPGEFKWVTFRITKENLAKLATPNKKSLFDIQFSCDEYDDFRINTGGEDPRLASIGVCGFVVCSMEDTETRLRFVESLATGSMNSMSNKPDEGTFLPLLSGA